MTKRRKFGRFVSISHKIILFILLCFFLSLCEATFIEHKSQEIEESKDGIEIGIHHQLGIDGDKNVSASTKIHSHSPPNHSLIGLNQISSVNYMTSPTACTFSGLIYKLLELAFEEHKLDASIEIESEPSIFSDKDIERIQKLHNLIENNSFYPSNAVKDSPYTDSSYKVFSGKVKENYIDINKQVNADHYDVLDFTDSNTYCYDDTSLTVYVSTVGDDDLGIYFKHYYTFNETSFDISNGKNKTKLQLFRCGNRDINRLAKLKYEYGKDDLYESGFERYTYNLEESRKEDQYLSVKRYPHLHILLCSEPVDLTNLYALYPDALETFDLIIPTVNDSSYHPVLKSALNTSSDTNPYFIYIPYWSVAIENLKFFEYRTEVGNWYRTGSSLLNSENNPHIIYDISNNEYQNLLTSGDLDEVLQLIRTQNRTKNLHHFKTKNSSFSYHYEHKVAYLYSHCYYHREVFVEELRQAFSILEDPGNNNGSYDPEFSNYNKGIQVDALGTCQGLYHEPIAKNLDQRYRKKNYLDNDIYLILKFFCGEF